MAAASQGAQEIFKVDSCPKEARKILAKYPNHVPIICKGGAPGSGLPPIQKKFLVQSNITTRDLAEVVRKHIKSQPAAGIVKGLSLCMLAGGIEVGTTDMAVRELYTKFRASDGFLYVTYRPANLPVAMIGDSNPTCVNERACNSISPKKLDKFSAEAKRVMAKHPDKVPVICKVKRAASGDILGTKKFLSPMVLMSNEFRDAIFERMEVVLKLDGTNIDKNMIKLLIEGEPLELGRPIGELYKKYKSEDGFLYVTAHYASDTVGNSGNGILGVAANCTHVLGTSGIENAPRIGINDKKDPKKLDIKEVSRFTAIPNSGVKTTLEFTLKVSFGQDTRRLLTSWSIDASTKEALAAIQTSVCDCFSPAVTPSNFVLKYKDSDGDLCTLVEMTLKDFLSFAQDGVLRLTMFENELAHESVLEEKARFGESLRSADNGSKIGNAVSPKATDSLHECFENESRSSDAITPWFKISTPPLTPKGSAANPFQPNINDEYDFEWSIMGPFAAATDPLEQDIDDGDESSG